MIPPGVTRVGRVNKVNQLVERRQHGRWRLRILLLRRRRWHLLLRTRSDDRFRALLFRAPLVPKLRILQNRSRQGQLSRVLSPRRRELIRSLQRRPLVRGRRRRFRPRRALLHAALDKVQHAFDLLVAQPLDAGHGSRGRFLGAAVRRFPTVERFDKLQRRKAAFLKNLFRRQRTVQHSTAGRAVLWPTRVLVPPAMLAGTLPSLALW
uniref:(northern house mosquito) hypothetical protein n=1 Tax=Culex pipiens TaxID=7175 RepID=A0A8D8J7Y4_CULPI